MLKRQNCYLLKKVNDTYWLLPYGQAVADQKKGCQLNETYMAGIGTSDV